MVVHSQMCVPNWWRVNLPIPKLDEISSWNRQFPLNFRIGNRERTRLGVVRHFISGPKNTRRIYYEAKQVLVGQGGEIAFLGTRAKSFYYLFQLLQFLSGF